MSSEQKNVSTDLLSQITPGTSPDQFLALIKDLLSEELKKANTQLYLSQKKALTFEEAIIYTGRTASNLYKLTSTRAIPHSKPKGKMIYFDREELEHWMLRNPVRTYESIDKEAQKMATLGVKPKGLN